MTEALGNRTMRKEQSVVISVFGRGRYHEYSGSRFGPSPFFVESLQRKQISVGRRCITVTESQNAIFKSPQRTFSSPSPCPVPLPFTEADSDTPAKTRFARCT
jgi:hypothetical protein